MTYEKNNPLGQSTDYPDTYSPELLFAIARADKRKELGLVDATDFYGEDRWTAYEVSWLNKKGKPQVAIADMIFSSESPMIVESKSLKLYLNSLNQAHFKDWNSVREVITNDVSERVKHPVAITLWPLHEYPDTQTIPGVCLDDLDIECSEYYYNPNLLKSAHHANNQSEVVSERLYSHLLKSNCLITSQPDWATLLIDYCGEGIEHKSLLQYIVSFRFHNEFHEQCVERIYCDLMNRFSLQTLSVAARYTRRGGIDINPWRSSDKQEITGFGRNIRQ